MRFLLFFFMIALIGLSVADNVCDLPRDPGPCKAYMPMYYYNKTTNQCEQFIYGGCQGNGNRFQQLQDCQDACVTCVC